MTRDGGYDMTVYQKYSPLFLAVRVDGQIVGVNSGHQISEHEFRSRGLFVSENWRRKGIGELLLRETIAMAREIKCRFCWSYPKSTALSVYLRAGYAVDPKKSVSGDSNFYVSLNLNHD